MANGAKKRTSPRKEGDPTAPRIPHRESLRVRRHTSQFVVLARSAPDPPNVTQVCAVLVVSTNRSRVLVEDDKSTIWVRDDGSDAAERILRWTVELADPQVFDQPDRVAPRGPLIRDDAQGVGRLRRQRSQQ